MDAVAVDGTVVHRLVLSTGRIPSSVVGASRKRGFSGVVASPDCDPHPNGIQSTSPGLHRVSVQVGVGNPRMAQRRCRSARFAGVFKATLYDIIDTPAFLAASISG